MIDETQLILQLRQGSQDPLSGRIFTLMGPNGVGKTRLLGRISRHLNAQGEEAVLIQAPRQIDFPSHQTFAEPLPTVSDIEDIPNLWSKAPKGAVRGAAPPNVSQSFAVIFDHFSKIDTVNETDFQKAAAAHLRGLVVERPTPPRILVDDLLGKLSAILDRRIIFDQENRQLVIVLDGEKVPIGMLSAGERQIVTACILMLSNWDNRFVFLVDEPELHLNDARAIEIWEKAEASFPNSVFLYATHSLAFATRPSVNGIISLNADGKMAKIDLQSGLDDQTIRAIVGGRVQIRLSDAPPVFVEDELMAAIVTDLMGDRPIQTVIVNGCDQVKAATKADGALSLLFSGSLKKCGVVDRDEWEETQLESFADYGVFAFPYYEAESILLDPKLLSLQISRICRREVDDALIRSMLVRAARGAYEKTVTNLAAHVASQVASKIGASFDGLDVTFKHADNSERDRILNDRVKAIRSALEREDAHDILRLFDGKLLYDKFISIADKELKAQFQRSPAQRYNELRNDVNFLLLLRSSPPLSDLRAKICSRIEI